MKMLQLTIESWRPGLFGAIKCPFSYINMLLFLIDFLGMMSFCFGFWISFFYQKKKLIDFGTALST